MRGAIEGKQAREYEALIKGSEITVIFDNFIEENVKPKSKICDFCCGPGNDIQLLKNKSLEIVGVDVSEEMIKICSEKFAHDKKVKLVLSSVTDTNLKSNYFDYVIIRMGLHHVKDKDKVIDEAYRILKPKGKLIVVEKYYLSLFELYWKGLKKLFLHFNPAVFQEFVVSKEQMYAVLFKRFKLLKMETLSASKWHTGRAFMCVLQK